MSSIGVSQAADRLDVSRQRVLQMIAEGRLPAKRVGRSWAVAEVDLARHISPSSRPLSFQMSRAFLALSGGERPQVDPKELSRLRKHMHRLVREVRDGDPANLLRSLLAKRAVRGELSVAEADLPDVLADPRLIISGVSHRVAGMSSPRMGEGYVDERNAQEFFDDHFIIQPDDRARANLVVHVAMVIPKISPIVIAADLADYREGREDRQARRVLEQWLASDEYDPSLLFGRSRP